jgi:hypothetical protein
MPPICTISTGDCTHRKNDAQTGGRQHVRIWIVRRRGEVHADPEPVDPAQPADAGADVAITVQRRTAVEDRPAGQFHLHPHLHRGADDDQPQQDEPGLGAE